MVDLEPLNDGAPVQIPVESINQVAFFSPHAADSSFGRGDGRAIIAVYTSAGFSGSRTALRPRRPTLAPRPRLERRFGAAVGAEWLDGGSPAPAVEPHVSVIVIPQLSFTVGVHQSTHSFERSFSGSITSSPLRIRYAFVEPRYQLVIGDAPIVVPFAGVRLLHGGWRLFVAHPLDPNPQVLTGNDSGGGVVTGATVLPWRDIAVETSVTYSQVGMDFYAFGNIGFILDEPIRVDGGYLLALRLGAAVRF